MRAWSFLLAVALTVFAAWGARAEIVVNEFLPAPGTDWTGNGEFSAQEDEWVELYSGGPTDIALHGWHIEDALGHSFALCRDSIAPGEHLLCVGDISLNNGGDTIKLIDDVVRSKLSHVPHTGKSLYQYR